MKNLIAFIHQHEGCRVEAVNGDTLTVSGLVSFDKDGAWTTERQSQTVKATLEAVRNWLGY